MTAKLGPRPLAASAAYAVVFVFASSSHAEPYVPGNDDEVLETLPSEFLATRDQLTELRERLSANPDDPQLASDVADRYIDLGKTDGDPRFYGYARAAIAPWWDAESPPPAILRLRAKLQEREHLYEKALVDLEELLDQEPDDAQALLELANINRVLGRYEAARDACKKLSVVAGIVAQTLCSAPIQAATGRAEDAYVAFEQILPLAREQLPTTVPWIVTMQAEISTALGRDEQAERHFREGLAIENYFLREVATSIYCGLTLTSCWTRTATTRRCDCFAITLETLASCYVPRSPHGGPATSSASLSLRGRAFCTVATTA